MVKKLVEMYDFDVNTEYGFSTPLSIAINLENGRKIVDYLLSKNADLKIAMESATIEGNLEGVKTLLNAGAKINGVNSEPSITIAANY